MEPKNVGIPIGICYYRQTILFIDPASVFLEIVADVRFRDLDMLDVRHAHALFDVRTARCSQIWTRGRDTVDVTISGGLDMAL